MEPLASWLRGEWVQGADAQRVDDATTGAAAAQVSSGGHDLAAALRFGRDVGGPALRALTFAERGAVLMALSEAIHAERDALIEVSRHGGTTRSDAKFDIDGAIGTLAYFASVGRRLGDRTVLVDGDAEPMLRSKRFVGQHLRTSRRGVAVHINAFNFPAWGMAEKLAVSLLGGVPAITKPATATAPLAHAIVARWVDDGILPDGALQLLLGDPGDLLDHLGPQDCVAFTGGSRTAAVIRSHPNLIRHNVALNIEADSLNAAVLGPDVEPGSDTFLMFVADVARDIGQKCGQKCTALRRVLVPAAVADAAQEALIDRLERLVVGDPAERETRVGPVASRVQHASVQQGLASLDGAAKRVWRGAAPEGTGFFVPPALYRSDAGVDAAFVHEHEVFGPVATLLPYTGGVDEAIAIVARGGGGLVASVYTDDANVGRELVLGLAPWHGRVHWGSRKVHDQSPGPGTVLPNLIHGGPGKAGGGQELGGQRGLHFYMPLTAVQADQGMLKRALGLG